jgi:hypothetical protein
MRTRLLTALSLTLFATGLAHGAQSRDFHAVTPIDAGGRLLIDSHNGSVSVSTWNQPSVAIDARIEQADFGGDPEDVEKTKVVVNGGGSEVRVESDYSAVPSHSFWFDFGSTHSLPLVHYTIRMPATARLRVSVHNATVRADGLKNDVEIETHNGGIDVTNLGGGARVETHNGNIRLDFSRYSAPSRVQTHNGSITVNLPADTRLSLTADGHSLKPTTQLPMSIQSTGSDFHAELNGGGPELRVTTHHGSLLLNRR